MTLYVISVPNPAVGKDWTYTIPGQYVEDVVAVSATLSTGTPLTTIADETGNGHTLTIQAAAGYSVGAAGPYGGGANNYAVAGDGAFHAGSAGFARSAASAAFVNAAGSCDYWMNVTAASDANQHGLVGLAKGSAGNAYWEMWFEANAGNPYKILQLGNGGGTVGDGPLAARGSWHHIGVTYNGVQYAYFIDGVAGPTHVGSQPGGSATATAVCPGAGGNQQAAPAKIGGVAWYPSVLSAARFAAHAGANGTAAAYRASVLADSPIALYMLNQVVSGAQRTVNLRVTNQSNTVAEIPAPVAAGTAAAFNYSWQTGLNSTTQTPDGTATTVAIPPLILPAGYTIGTHTLDLAATDQWSAINIWWDDDYQQNTVNLSAYEYAPGALLRWRPYSPGI